MPEDWRTDPLYERFATEAAKAGLHPRQIEVVGGIMARKLDDPASAGQVNINELQQELGRVIGEWASPEARDALVATMGRAVQEPIVEALQARFERLDDGMDDATFDRLSTLAQVGQLGRLHTELSRLEEAAGISYDEVADTEQSKGKDMLEPRDPNPAENPPPGAADLVRPKRDVPVEVEAQLMEMKQDPRYQRHDAIGEAWRAKTEQAFADAYDTPTEGGEDAPEGE